MMRVTVISVVLSLLSLLLCPGRAAAQVLFRRLDGDRAPSEHQIVLTRLIARGSGEIAP